MEAHDRPLSPRDLILQQDLFRWGPKPWVDPPISMLEYAMQEGEIDAAVKNGLLAAQFETTAEVHEAIAKGARTAAELLRAG
jgi:hypothetical protein